jgi:DnaJ-class molecular chaperone
VFDIDPEAARKTTLRAACSSRWIVNVVGSGERRQEVMTMPSKDYYVILGISPEEPQTGVTNAWRDLARKYHPDRAGQDATRQFQEVSEAYNVLGDPQRRAAYDRSRRYTVGEASNRPAGAGKSFTVEPLDPGPVRSGTRRSGSGGLGRLSIMDDFVAPHSAFDDIFARFRRNFTDEWMPKSGRQEALELGLHLSPEEARRGGTVRHACTGSSRANCSTQHVGRNSEAYCAACQRRMSSRPAFGINAFGD